jgi:hypothetical protein
MQRFSPKEGPAILQHDHMVSARLIFGSQRRALTSHNGYDPESRAAQEGRSPQGPLDIPLINHGRDFHGEEDLWRLRGKAGLTADKQVQLQNVSKFFGRQVGFQRLQQGAEIYHAGAPEQRAEIRRCLVLIRQLEHAALEAADSVIRVLLSFH